jgi:DNA repair exonuclease SbcCD ATPase subunit
VTIVADQPPASNGPAPTAPPESLDQVRDILFGGQMRMVDARLQGLESRMQQEQASMRAEFSRELADVDANLNRGIAQLNEQLTAERAKRADDLKALSADMKELVKSLERRHQALEEAASQADADLRDHLVRQSAQQTADLTRTAERLSNQLEAASTKLTTDKLDTSALATGLTDLVSRLTSTGYTAPAKSKTKD